MILTNYVECKLLFNSLGLIFDTHLKWNFYVRKVANKLTQINWHTLKVQTHQAGVLHDYNFSLLVA